MQDLQLCNQVSYKQMYYVNTIGKDKLRIVGDLAWHVVIICLSLIETVNEQII